MSGFNMPPGVSPFDIPGNDKPAKFRPRQRLTPAFLRPLPQPVQLPSMLRQQRLCRIALRAITVEIGQRYAREQAAGQGFN